MLIKFTKTVTIQLFYNGQTIGGCVRYNRKNKTFEAGDILKVRFVEHGKEFCYIELVTKTRNNEDWGDEDWYPCEVSFNHFDYLTEVPKLSFEIHENYSKITGDSLSTFSRNV